MAARWWTILALIQPSWSTDTGRFGFFFRFWKMACNNDKNRVVLCVCVCVAFAFLSFVFQRNQSTMARPRQYQLLACFLSLSLSLDGRQSKWQ